MSSLADDHSELIGFFSYSREDDEDSQGALSKLRDRIQRELRSQLGRSRTTFRLWQDKEAIAPGKLWETEIKGAIEQSVFFIPIVTPTAVRSGFCHQEFEAFLARERALGRTDLVFPIYYIRVPALERDKEWRADPVLSIIGQRQWTDWLELRHLDDSDIKVREAVARFCAKIADALQGHHVSPEERRRRAEEAEKLAKEADARAANEQQIKEEAARRAEAEARQRQAEARERAQAAGSLIGTLWPETSRNSSARRGILVVATALALFLAYLLGDAIDVTASKAFSAIYVPAAAFLVIAAAYDFRLTAIIVPLATVMLMIVHILSFYSHFPLLGSIFYALTLIVGQLAAAFVVQRLLGNDGPPPLWRMMVGMAAAGLTYEFFDTAGAALRYLTTDAASETVDWIIKNEYRWYSACYAAGAAIVVYWVVWRLALRRTR